MTVSNGTLIPNIYNVNLREVEYYNVNLHSSRIIRRRNTWNFMIIINYILIKVGVHNLLL